MLSVPSKRASQHFQTVGGGNIAAETHPDTDRGFGNLSTSATSSTADPLNFSPDGFPVFPPE
jgi:hypothetical protein